MAARTHYAQHLWLNWLRGSAFPSPPAGLYLGLLTASPTDAGATTGEVTGGGYARQPFTLGAASDATSGATVASAGAITFPTATGAWGTVTHCAVFDAVTGGNMLLYGPISPPPSVVAGYIVSLPAGNLTDTAT